MCMRVKAAESVVHLFAFICDLQISFVGEAFLSVPEILCVC